MAYTTRTASGKLRRDRRRGKSILTLVVLTCLSSAGVYFFTSDDPSDGGVVGQQHQQQLVELEHQAASATAAATVVDSDLSYRRRQQADPPLIGNVEERNAREDEDAEDNRQHQLLLALSNTNNITVCGRATSFPKALSLQLEDEYKWSKCPSRFNPETPTLVLEGYDTFGRTGNHLRTFLNALQLVRDANYQLAIMYNSWAMGVIVQFFFASNDKHWEARIEDALCIKIIHDVSELQGWRVVLKDTKSIFRYHSLASPRERQVGQLHTLRALYANYNTGGEGLNQFGDKVKDMCSGIDYFFGKRKRGKLRNVANYTVIHMRYLEGPPGLRILANVAKATGCDPVGALQMSPSYVKSILEPLGMLDKEIVIITDGQSDAQLNRLMADPDLGRVIRLLPAYPVKTSWFGGDVMLAVMANVFIGNPASTMSGFIARSRVALGFEGSSYLYRAKDELGQWATVCGDDCLFDIIDLPDQDTTTTEDKAAAASKKEDPSSSSVHEETTADEPEYKVGRMIIPKKPRITLNQAHIERESQQASQELKQLARGSRVYTGLHPDDLAKKKILQS